MIVERITWKLKPGCRPEAIEVLKAGALPDGPTFRIYTFMFGGNDETVVVEAEHETIEDREKFWADWGTQPKADETVMRFRELMETGGVHELLRVH